MENVAKTHSSFPSLIHKVSTSLCTSIPFSFFSKCFSAVLQSWLLWEICCHHSTQNVLDTQVLYFLPVLSLQLPACFLYLGYPGLLLVFLGHASLIFLLEVPSAWSFFCYVFSWIKLSYILQSLGSYVTFSN